jgi:hypothetical protein
MTVGLNQECSKQQPASAGGVQTLIQRTEHRALHFCPRRCPTHIAHALVVTRLPQGPCSGLPTKTRAKAATWKSPILVGYKMSWMTTQAIRSIPQRGTHSPPERDCDGQIADQLAADPTDGEDRGGGLG